VLQYYVVDRQDRVCDAPPKPARDGLPKLNLEVNLRMMPSHAKLNHGLNYKFHRPCQL
jgi:hypothetical protein